MVTIATYNEPAKAKRLKDKFKQAGVKADLHNEANLQTYAFMSKPQANAKVMVEEQDFQRAHRPDGGMGSGRSRHRRDPLPAVQFDPHRVSAADAQVSHPGAGRQFFSR